MRGIPRILVKIKRPKSSMLPTYPGPAGTIKPRNNIMYPNTTRRSGILVNPNI